ncbi:hypothetical protein ACFL02_04955 [Planctomycetota bacterium]
MKSTKTKLLLTASILVCLTGWALAQDQQIPARQIKFETSEQQEDWQLAWEGFGVIEPKYVAKFTLLDDRTMVRRNGDIIAEAEQWLKKVVSEQQRDFIEHGRYFVNKETDGIRLYQQFWLYAVNAEDAQKMAEGFIDYLDDKANNALQETKNKLKVEQKTLEDAEKRIPEIEAELKPLREQEKILADQFNYTQARQKIDDYTKMLNMLKIDIAGYQAKVEVLRESMKSIPRISPPGTPQLYAAVKQMLIEQEAELAGALARKKEIENQMLPENEYIQARSRLMVLTRELTRLTRIQRTNQDYEKNLADPPPAMRPVEVFENKVVIHPIREK